MRITVWSLVGIVSVVAFSVTRVPRTVIQTAHADQESGGGGGDNGGSSGGNNGGDNGGGNGGATPTDTPTPTPTPIPPAYNPSILQNNTVLDINTLYTKSGTAGRPSNLFDYLTQQFPPVTQGGTTFFPSITAANRAVFTGFAQSQGGESGSPSVTWLINGGIPGCSTSSSSGICVEASAIGDANNPYSQYANTVWLTNSTSAVNVSGINSTSFQSVGLAVFRNAGTAPATLRQNDLKLRVTDGSGNTFTSTLPPGGVQIPGASSGFCTLAITGREGPDYSRSCPNNAPCASGDVSQVTFVENGNQVVTPVPGGVSGANATVTNVSYNVDSGSPPDNITGLWKTLGVDSPTLLNATVTLGNGQVVYCAGKFQARGVPLLVKTGTSGDCDWFYALQEYYLTTPDPAHPGQNIACNCPHGWNNGAGFSFPGLTWQNTNPGTPATYAKTFAEVPAAGILELGAQNDGSPFYLGPNGETSTPPIAKRKWAALVMAAYVLGGKTNDMGLPIYYAAVTDTSVFPNVRLVPTGQPLPSDPNAQIGLFTYLAASSPVTVNGVTYEQRGTDTAPYWVFYPGDKPIFAMHTSCSEANQVGYPVISEKGSTVPTRISSVPVCLTTTPINLLDLQKGLGRVILARHLPQYANETYDPRLFLLNKQGPCVPSNPNDTVQCLQPAQGAPTSSFYSGSSDQPCQYTVAHTGTAVGTGSYCIYDQYGNCVRRIYYNYTYTYVWYETRYHGNCTVMHVTGCYAEAALRFAQYEQGRMAAAACFLKYDSKPYDLQGTQIAPVLLHQGSMPLTATVGGSVPRYYTNYPPSLLPPNADYKDTNGTPQQTGVGCVPCLLRGQANSGNVANLNADFDAPTQRQPLYNFSWSTAARECSPVADSTKLGIFGSDQCVGVPNTQFFCGSGNVPASTTCPGGAGETSTLGDGSTVNFTSGGNNYLVMQNVRWCPGSILATNSIVSASPLILDVNGGGIRISRNAKEAVKFDIYGTGKPRLVDWPVNTDEVAFLALPGKDGKVTSIQQLFGDYKAKNGFEALRKLDSNGDGVIDEKDKAFKNLRLWFDRNRDGVAQKDELVKLSDAGVTRILLTYNKPIGGGIEGKTLNSQYLNTKARTYRNIEDQWFYLYSQDGARVTSAKGAKKKGAKK